MPNFGKIAKDDEKGVVHEDMKTPWWVFPLLPTIFIGFLFLWAKIMWFFGSRVDKAEDPLEALLWIIGFYIVWGGLVVLFHGISEIIENEL